MECEDDLVGLVAVVVLGAIHVEFARDSRTDHLVVLCRTVVECRVGFQGELCAASLTGCGGVLQLVAENGAFHDGFAGTGYGLFAGT